MDLSTRATEVERLLIHDGKGLEALKSMQDRGYLFSDAVKVMDAVRRDLDASRKALAKLNKTLNEAFTPILENIFLVEGD